MTVRILIVDDSATARKALRAAMELESDFEVVGELDGGEGVLETIERLEPDLITLDYFLERGSAPTVVADIMSRSPCPVLVVTGADARNRQVIHRSMEAGALEVLAKLPAPSDERYDEHRRRLVRIVRTLQTVPLVTRRTRRKVAGERAELPQARPEGPASAVVLGASTGGPPALAKLLGALPAPFPIPIAIVQHLLNGFAPGLQTWLAQATGHEVVLCEGVCELRRGVVYVAPDDRHLVFLSDRTIAAREGPPRGPHRPSIDVLFESAVEQLGPRVVGALLTGMGSDGARGLERLHAAGATTLAQAPGTCAVDSMPRAAIALGAVSRTGSPLELAGAILKRCRVDPEGARQP